MQFILINSSNSHCNSLSCTIPKHCIRCKAYVLIVVSVLPKSIFLERKTMLQSKWNYQKNKVQSHTSDKLQILWNNLNTLSLAGEYLFTLFDGTRCFRALKNSIYCIQFARNKSFTHSFIFMFLYNNFFKYSSLLLTKYRLNKLKIFQTIEKSLFT